MSNNINILIAEDEEQFLRSISLALRTRGYNVLTFNNGESALFKIIELNGTVNQIDLLITDIQMPKMTGEELIDNLRSYNIDVSVLVMTGFGDKSMVVRLMRKGIADYIDKPFNVGELLTILEPITKNITENKNDLSELYSGIASKEKVELKLLELNNRYKLLSNEVQKLEEVYTSSIGINSDLMPIQYFNKPKSFTGGDFLSVNNHYNGLLAMIADISGHDISASFYTMILKTIFDDYSFRVNTGMELIDVINKTFLNNPNNDRAVTAIAFRINRYTNSAEITFAGHSPIIYYNVKKNQLKIVYERGSVLGLLEKPKIATANLNIFNGDRFYLFTDGLLAATRFNNINDIESLGHIGLEEIVSRHVHLPFEESNEKIWNDVVGFCNNKFNDDALLMCLEVKNLEEI